MSDDASPIELWIDLLEDPDIAVSRAAQESLTFLLESEASLTMFRLDPPHADKLNRLLEFCSRSSWPVYQDVRFVVAVIAAMARVGDRRTCYHLGRLGESCSQPDVREAACQALPVLRQYLESGDRSRLLRPSADREEMRRRLLRHAPPPSEDELLHPSPSPTPKKRRPGGD